MHVQGRSDKDPKVDVIGSAVIPRQATLKAITDKMAEWTNLDDIPEFAELLRGIADAVLRHPGSKPELLDKAREILEDHEVHE